MKFHIEFLVKGPAGQLWAPNKENPVEAFTLQEVLKRLSEEMPSAGIVEFIGVKVVPGETANGNPD